MESSASLQTNPTAISDRASRMPASPIRRIFMAARALQEAGTDVLRLDIGDPDFDLPAHFSVAIKAALDAGHTHYSPMGGIPELRAALASHLLRRYGLTASAEQVIVNQGATEGLNAALTLTCDPGDTIVMPEIYWPNYMQQIALANVRPVFYQLDARFQPILTDLPALAQQIAATGSRVGAVLVNSPSNPTGALFPRETVATLYAFARQLDAWLISDEAYCDYVFAGEHVSPLALEAQLPVAERRVLGVFSASKSYAATGLRLGWTVAPTPEVAARLQVLNEPLTGSMTTPLQYGLAAAVAVEDAQERRDALLPRWELAHEILAAAGLESGRPQGGLFYFIDISRAGLDAEQFADQLLEREHVAVVPGNGFGLYARLEDGHQRFEASQLSRKHVRVCFAVPQQRLREGLTRLTAFHNQLAGGAAR